MRSTTLSLSLVALFSLSACTAAPLPEESEEVAEAGQSLIKAYPCPVAAFPFLIFQTGGQDCDGDELTNAAEDAQGTLHADYDTDDDGLPDGWEVNGHDHGATYGFIDYPAAFGTDPLKRDLLVEIDYHDYTDVAGVHHSALPSDAVQEKLVEYYESLPISNPDGSLGIHLVLVPDELLGEGNGLIDVVAAGVTPAAFDCYVDPNSAAGDHSQHAYPRETFRKLTICIGAARGNGVIAGISVKYRTADTNTDPLDDWTETAQHTNYRLFLHEIGHSLGLLHGGNENMNYKVNYPSVMNYRYTDSLCNSPKTLLDTDIGYSTGEMPALDACVLPEIDAFPGLTAADVCFLGDGDPAAAATYDQPYTYQVTPTGKINVDWNRNGVKNAGTVVGAISDASTAGCAAGGSVLVEDFDDLARIAQCMSKPLLEEQGQTPPAGCP